MEETLVLVKITLKNEVEGNSKTQSKFDEYEFKLADENKKRIK